MHSPDEVFGELEEDRRSREAEIRLIERLSEAAESQEEASMLRRSLVLVCYAHLEGFCKFALASYANAINSYKLSCGEVSPAIVAASLSKLFAALRENNYKHDMFKKSLPDDSILHMSAREIRFVESIDGILKAQVEITERSYDTKSNVDTDVLKKLLFQLGLELTDIDFHRPNINRLLGIRNAIAHGDRLHVPKDERVREYIATTSAVMQRLQEIVYTALSERIYLKPQISAA